MTTHATEKQVIEYLKELRDSLLQEIKSIDKTIEGITATNSSVNKSSYFGKAVDEQFIAEKMMKKILTPNDRFDPLSKLDQKISYALTNVGQGFKEDILDVLYQKQPDIDPHKLEKVLAVRLSYLLKNGFIDGRKIGRRFEYTLKAQ